MECVCVCVCVGESLRESVCALIRCVWKSVSIFLLSRNPCYDDECRRCDCRCRHRRRSCCCSAAVLWPSPTLNNRSRVSLHPNDDDESYERQHRHGGGSKKERRTQTSSSNAIKESHCWIYYLYECLLNVDVPSDPQPPFFFNPLPRSSSSHRRST